MPRAKMEKKGAEATISVYWFVIIVIVAGAIIYMVSIVYGQPYDVRKAEAGILASNVADCVSEGGYLKENVLGDESFKNNFLEVCGLNFDTENAYDWKSQGQYYAEVNFYDFETGANSGFSISVGNPNLKAYCGMNGNTLPYCVNQSFYALDRDQNSYRVEVISVVNKGEKNVQ
jgi:hypothetical protein